MVRVFDNDPEDQQLSIIIKLYSIKTVTQNKTAWIYIKGVLTFGLLPIHIFINKI